MVFMVGASLWGAQPAREHGLGSPVFSSTPAQTASPTLEEGTFLSFPTPGKSSGGKSFGSSSFKSIKSFDTGRTSSSSSSLPSTSTSSVTVYHSYSPPVVFFWTPGVGHGGFSGEAALGWFIILVVIGLVILMVVVLATRKRSVDSGEKEEIDLFLDRSKKNLNHLANRYVDAQGWIERLEGKIPQAEWKEMNDSYTEVSIEDFTRQIQDIEAHISRGELATARTLLFSFDDDAVEVFEFLEGIEERMRKLDGENPR